MIKATLELTDGQLLDVIQFVKERGITAVFEGTLLLEIGKSYRNRKGEVVMIESEEYGMFISGKRMYYANGWYIAYFETELNLIEEVK